MSINSVRYKAVSYTHLDVYKRQSKDNEMVNSSNYAVLVEANGRYSPTEKNNSVCGLGGCSGEQRIQIFVN